MNTLKLVRNGGSLSEIKEVEESSLVVWRLVSCQIQGTQDLPSLGPIKEILRIYPKPCLIRDIEQTLVDLFSEALILNHSICASDHGTIFLDTSISSYKSSPPFKTKSIWFQYKSCLDLIDKFWRSYTPKDNILDIFKIS